DRRLRLRREVVSHLGHLGLELRQRGVRVVVELQVHGDRGKALGARRLHVIDAVGTRDHALERGGDEAPHEVGVRADVDGRDRDDGRVAPRVLADGERADRLQPRDQDHEVDADREDRPLDEEVGEFHQLSSGLGAGLLPGWTLLLTWTAAPVRSLKTPDVTTCSPFFSPERTAIWSPRDGPRLPNSWRTPR